MLVLHTLLVFVHLLLFYLVIFSAKCTESDLQVPMPQTEFNGMDELLKEAEDEDNNKSTDDAAGDDQLVNEYLKDNSGQFGSLL